MVRETNSKTEEILNDLFEEDIFSNLEMICSLSNKGVLKIPLVERGVEQYKSTDLVLEVYHHSELNMPGISPLIKFNKGGIYLHDSDVHFSIVDISNVDEKDHNSLLSKCGFERLPAEWWCEKERSLLEKEDITAYFDNKYFNNNSAKQDLDRSINRYSAIATAEHLGLIF